MTTGKNYFATNADGSLQKNDDGTIRKFATGATRDTAVNKFDYEAFLSPIVLKRFAEYMHKCRIQSNGELRDADNWQLGIAQDVYIKSAFRHFMDWWHSHRGDKTVNREEALCAMMFNVMGYLFEELRNKNGTE